MTDPNEEFISKEEVDRYRRVARTIARRADAAKKHPGNLLEFALREETSRLPIRLLAFQRVAFDFMMAHVRCVIRMPVGFGKTYMATAMTLWLLGNDPTSRGIVLSETATQAEKVVGAVRDYIEQSQELKLVFPELRQSGREADPWQRGRLTVQRPWGIRDPSLTATGLYGALPGSRLSWILVDDILSENNTTTKEAREKVRRWVFSSVVDRLDVDGARMCVTQVPWAEDDLTYALQALGWPVLQMDAEGNVRFFNTDWDTDDIRPSTADPEGLDHRLVEHDAPTYAVQGHAGPQEAERIHIEHVQTWVDHSDMVPLWPEKYDSTALAAKLHDLSALEYNRKFLMKPRSEEDSFLKQDWVERAKAEARARGYFAFPAEWHETMCFTGVDLAISRKKKSANNSIFTYTIIPGGWRLPLRVETGKWTGIETIKRIGQHIRAFDSIARVETNAAQDYLRQWALQLDVGLPIRAHNTGKNKHDKRHGLASIFLEFENGAWLLPNDPEGKLAGWDGKNTLDLWLSEMYSYNPDEHTGDVLMSSWIAREEAYVQGHLTRELEHGLLASIAQGAAAR